MSTLPFRVTVVDDHALFAEALVISLRGQSVDARSVVPEAATTTFPQLGRAIVDSRPHLVLLDLDLGVVGDTMRLLSTLAAGNVPVVVVTGSADGVRRGEALAMGARAVISKSAPFSQILDAVERTRSGLPVMSRMERDELLSDYRDATESRRELHAKFSSDDATRGRGPRSADGRPAGDRDRSRRASCRSRPSVRRSSRSCPSSR